MGVPVFPDLVPFERRPTRLGLALHARAHLVMSEAQSGRHRRRNECPHLAMKQTWESELAGFRWSFVPATS